ncbi:AraC family transcriptional regulator [Pelomonas sp. SE-A7]|uniref:AraC family transcriptional regulator n=1 Tax=Pelomonas sp. SE-A7 TaxID=3054953 RepID=UPI00259C844D|nr:AraC family transcriptional regulator [Pelomonas sp. SE-A7]MDM4768056.1 AraC family transcriptional regulator [Pelomonas sp. SE-A7]
MSRNPPFLSLGNSRQAQCLQRALDLVEARLDQPLTAELLAEKAALSRFHFHRIFQAHVGCSVASYLAWRRLQRACALLVSGAEPVLEIALEVGFESAQALAKAMRRELGCTPTDIRRGLAQPAALPPWRRPDLVQPSDLDTPMLITPTRQAQLPEGLTALTATGRGMVANTMVRAAQQAYAELQACIGPLGLQARVGSWMCLVPDDPKGPDDPHCRYVAGLIFGYSMAEGSGRCERPELPLSGTLQWQEVAAGRYAVFTHIGPYSNLHRTWAAIYRDWLPASGEKLRELPPLELMLNSPQNTPPEKLHTEIWMPLQA